jgi:hypothetical protein
MTLNDKAKKASSDVKRDDGDGYDYEVNTGRADFSPLSIDEDEYIEARRLVIGHREIEKELNKAQADRIEKFGARAFYKHLMKVWGLPPKKAARETCRRVLHEC